MTLDDLRVFVAVCEAGSLSAVARNLERTQPAISQHIARLERELDIKLFERHATGVVPTVAGRELREAAFDGLDAIAAGIRRIRELRYGEIGSLAITTGGTTVRHFLRASVVRFRRLHPDVPLAFVPAHSTARCLEVLRAGQADLALVTIGEPQRGIEQRPVARQALRLLVPKDDPLARRKRIELAELDGVRYIGLAESTTSRGYIERAMAELGIKVHVTMTVDDFDTACVFVELGVGYALVPAVHAANFARSARIRSLPVTGLAALPIGLAARRWATLPRVAHVFVDIFIADMARMRGIPGLELLPA